MAHFMTKQFSTSVEGYRIELAKKSRLSQVLKFLRENYHDEEKIVKILKANAQLTEEDIKLIEEDEDNGMITPFESSPCLIAIHNETDEIAGAVLTTLINKSQCDQGGAGSSVMIASTEYKSDLMREYYGYLAKIDQETNVFDKYPNAQTALELYVIAVGKEHQKKGLAVDLSLAAIEVAKNLPGPCVVFGFYSSIYSKRLAEKIGMNKIMDFNLADLVNSEGISVFQNLQKPENIVWVLAIEINGSE